MHPPIEEFYLIAGGRLHVDEEATEFDRDQYEAFLQTKLREDEDWNTAFMNYYADKFVRADTDFFGEGQDGIITLDDFNYITYTDLDEERDWDSWVREWAKVTKGDEYSTLTLDTLLDFAKEEMNKSEEKDVNAEETLSNYTRGFFDADRNYDGEVSFLEYVNYKIESLKPEPDTYEWFVALAAEGAWELEAYELQNYVFNTYPESDK
jgi:hypothetical protein